MACESARPPLRLILSRVAYRLARRVLGDPLTIVLVAVVTAMWLLLPGAQPSATPAADAAEQYLEGLRDRDTGRFLSALSPQARKALELRFGHVGVGAASALFREQESRGERVISWERIGDYRTVQGEELRFYVVRYARDDEHRDIPYVLTIDGSGRVARVE